MRVSVPCWGCGGIKISERTLSSDIKALKSEFRLLPLKERLREGYELESCLTLGSAEAGLVVDALSAFAITLNDPDAYAIANRILISGTTGQGSRQPESGLRVLGHRNIVRRNSTNESVEDLVMSSMRSRIPTRIHYCSPRTRSSLKVDVYPLFKIFHQRAWYAIARDLPTGDYYPLRLDRIETCKPLPASANENWLNNCNEARFLISCGWGMTFPKNIGEAEHDIGNEAALVRFDASIADYILTAFLFSFNLFCGPVKI